MTNLSRADSVRKCLATPQMNWIALGACATTKAEKGSGWNIAACNCPAMAVTFDLVQMEMPILPRSMMKMEDVPTARDSAR